ncbi:MAG: hypothetical protein E7Z92_07665 [Cyanobacteria bacterium SIG31]|nr:hypothetical protein [Cyanobacteria bacterium SIG31]
MIPFNKIFYFSEDCENIIFYLFGFKLFFYNAKNINLKKLAYYIKKKKSQKALSQINYIIKKYRIEILQKNLLIAHYSKENGFVDENILKNAKIFNTLEINEKNCLFENYLKQNKTIALVGNSGCELGKNKGKEIDSHDVVIRFNNYPDGFEKDYGSKTNVWVHCCNSDVIQRDISNFDFVMWRYNFYTKNIGDHFENELFNNITKYPQKTLSLSKPLEETSKFLNIKDPTTGAILIYILIKTFNSLENVDFYGFSFLEDLNNTAHYYDNESRIATDHPEFTKEQKTLVKLIKKYKKGFSNEKINSGYSSKKRQ